jgi:hypothetical protein
MKQAKKHLNPLTVRLDPKYHSEILRIHKKEKVSKGEVLRRIVELGFEVYEKDVSPAKEAAKLRASLKHIKETLEEAGI